MNIYDAELVMLWSFFQFVLFFFVFISVILCCYLLWLCVVSLCLFLLLNYRMYLLFLPDLINSAAQISYYMKVLCCLFYLLTNWINQVSNFSNSFKYYSYGFKDKNVLREAFSLFALWFKTNLRILFNFGF